MEIVVDKSGERLDKYLASELKQFSRTKLQNFIRLGMIKVNGVPAQKPSMELKGGDRITILEEKIISPREEFKVEPEPDIPLEIIYEDKDILVINKPAGLLVHPTLSQKNHTLANALAARYPEMAK